MSTCGLEGRGPGEAGRVAGPSSPVSPLRKKRSKEEDCGEGEEDENTARGGWEGTPAVTDVEDNGSLT